MKQRQTEVIIFLIFFSGIFFAGTGFAQEKDSTSSKPLAAIKNNIQISGYVDAYYSYFTDSLPAGTYQKLATISPRSNSFGLNIAMITAKYSSDKIRGVVTLHYGDIAQSSWSSKYNVLQEANVGIAICKKLWLDAGFFRTHIGTEGLLPKENIASSLAIGTYFEPYYQAGFKLSYAPSDKLAISLHALNGYNIFDDNNKKKSVGLLVNYTFNDNFNIGYSNYYGDDSPDGTAYTATQTRFFNNLYLNFLYKKIKIQLGGDYCVQENSDIATMHKSAAMYSGLLSIKFQAAKKFAVYARGEILNDDDGFMTGVITDNIGRYTGLSLWGATLGFEYKPTDNSYIRIEGRDLQMDKDQKIFYWDKKYTASRLEMLLNIGMSF